jgi:hypothetical protein
MLLTSSFLTLTILFSFQVCHFYAQVLLQKLSNKSEINYCKQSVTTYILFANVAVVSQSQIHLNHYAHLFSIGNALNDDTIDCFIGVIFLIPSSFREKSWSVLLSEGYILNNQVRAKYCENCNSKSEVLTTNFSYPNLLLYGCRDSKCKHRLLRLNFNDEHF